MYTFLISIANVKIDLQANEWKQATNQIKNYYPYIVDPHIIHSRSIKNKKKREKKKEHNISACWCCLLVYVYACEIDTRKKNSNNQLQFMQGKNPNEPFTHFAL